MRTGLLIALAFTLAGFGCSKEVPDGHPEKENNNRASSPTCHYMDCIAFKFLAELRDGNHRGAYALMSSTYRAANSLEAFRASVAASFYLAKITKVGYASGSTKEKSGVAEGVLTSSIGVVRYTLHFVQQGERWFITTAVIAGVPALGVGVGAQRAPASQPIRPPH